MLGFFSVFINFIILKKICVFFFFWSCELINDYFRDFYEFLLFMFIDIVFFLMSIELEFFKIIEYLKIL